MCGYILSRNGLALTHPFVGGLCQREMNVTLAHSSNISPDVDDLQGLS